MDITLIREKEINEIGFNCFVQFGVTYYVLGWGYKLSGHRKVINKEMIEVINTKTNGRYCTDLMKFKNGFMQYCKIELKTIEHEKTNN